MSFPYDEIRRLIEADYAAAGDDDGEPTMIGAVCITANAHHADGSSKSVFFHDGGLDEAIGLLIRHSDILRNIRADDDE